MKTIALKAALALSLAAAPIAAPVAFAETPASPFRSVEPQTFTAEDLQRYGLTQDEAATVQSYQEQGYQVQLLTPEEAEAYNAGLSNTNILALIGLVAIVVVVAAAI